MKYEPILSLFVTAQSITLMKNDNSMNELHDSRCQVDEITANISPVHLFFLFFGHGSSQLYFFFQKIQLP